MIRFLALLVAVLALTTTFVVSHPPPVRLQITQADAQAICYRDSECSDPLVCRHGRCQEACHADRDCGPYQQCLLTSAGVHVCQLDVPPPQPTGPASPSCTDNRDCTHGTCQNAVCPRH